MRIESPLSTSHGTSLRVWLFFAIAAAVSVVSSCKRSQANAAVLVFTAASTADAITEIGKAFAATPQGVQVRLSSGASRDLARQISAGAPADVFVSADAESVDTLTREGLVSPEDRRRLMTNRLVVVVPVDSAAPAQMPNDLIHARPIAMGDPLTVPAGIYARKWLEKVSMWREVANQIVPTNDVRAALAAVESGHAQAAIVYRTDAITSRKAKIVYEVPREDGPDITYVAARLSRSKVPAATAFLEFLTQPAAREVFGRQGFVLGP